MEDDTLDSIDTIDTRVDTEVIEDTDPQEGFDTVQETPLDSLELDPVTLAAIHGSMRWEHSRR